MLRRLGLLALGAALIPAGSLLAQGTCAIETANPPELRGARDRLVRIGAPENSARNEKPQHLKSGMRLLVENDRVARNRNQVGRSYLLGKLLALWLRQEGSQPFETRETLGLSGNQEEKLDLFRLVDSAFNVVEASNAHCIDSTRQYREAVFSDVYNPAVTAVNARQYDTALVLIERALVVAPRSGKSWNVIAQAKYGLGDMEGYAEALQKVIELGPEDPVLKAVVDQAYMNLGTLRLQEAQRAEGEARITAARRAEEIYRKYTELRPDDPTGMVRLANALQILGDSAGVARIYDAMLQSPDRFTSTSLAEAGVASFRGQHYDEALVFFGESLKKNPYHAQTLFNYINTAISASQLDEATERLGRLFEVDPSNTDNFTLAARAWQAVFLDSASTVERKQMSQDSTLKYLVLHDSAEVSVKFDPFVAVPGNAQTLQGLVENKTEAAKSYELSVECLNEKGESVASAAVPVPDVGPNSGKRFRAACRGAGIVAFRYKPLM